MATFGECAGVIPNVILDHGVNYLCCCAFRLKGVSR
jgi:hypothetical protein